MKPTLASAAAFDSATLAAAFTAGYEGYAVPVSLDGAAFEAMVSLSDVDLSASRVALDGGAPVGVALLARRGEASWVAGLGVVSPARRTGVGEALMRSLIAGARAGGATHVLLEVLEGNEAAIALYDKLGFRTVRVLEIWSLDDSGATGETLVAGGHDAVHAWIRAHRDAGEPWQRADERIGCMCAHGRPPAGLVLERGGETVAAALVPAGGGPASIVQLAAVDDAAAQGLLAAIAAAQGGVRFVNVPAGTVASRALAALGGRLDLRQLELRLDLRG